MKKIYLDVAGRMHSLYSGFLRYPPSGYMFVTQDNSWDGVSNAAIRNNSIYTFQERVLSKIIPVNMAKAYLERLKKPPSGTSLTYSTGHLVFRKEPWVVDLEFVTQLAGYNINHFRRYRRLIERRLASKYCKGIICWTHAGKRTLLQNMNCQGFKHKIKVIPLAVPKKEFVKTYRNDGKVRLLFVDSANIPGQFDIKGGKEILEAFAILCQRYPNLELVVRSNVPRHIKNCYQELENLRFVDKIIAWKDLEKEFKLTDVFLYPSHATPGLAILDAMSYELPVITTSIWANPEMVVDGETGLLISESRQVLYYVEDSIPNWNYLPGSPFMKSIELVDPVMVNELVEKASILIENPELRRKMGRAGRRQIETGVFSVEKRNEKLKRVLDEATNADSILNEMFAPNTAGR